MVSDEGGRRQIEHQAPIHLLVEIEVKAVESPLRIAKLCPLAAPFQQSVTTTRPFIRHQTGKEVDRCHRLRLGLLEGGVQKRGHAPKRSCRKERFNSIRFILVAP